LNKYEAIVILDSSLREAAFDKAVEMIQGEITKGGGKIKDCRVVGERSFARTLGKKNSGQYVRVLFEADPQAIVSLSGRYRLHEEIFRVQILRADTLTAAGGKPPEVKEEAAGHGGS
jgi:ribosomal protein S6